MFKIVNVPTKMFDTNIIKPNARAILSLKEDYFCPSDNKIKEYKTYEGIISEVHEDMIRFVSDDTFINFYSDSIHPEIDKWFTVEDIDGYWTKLELM